MVNDEDIIGKRPTKSQIKDLRARYNNLIDSIFYCLNDVQITESELNNKYIELKKLQAQARACDELINKLILGNGYTNNKTGVKTSKKIAIQQLKTLSEMSKKIYFEPKLSGKNKYKK